MRLLPPCGQTYWACLYCVMKKTRQIDKKCQWGISLFLQICAVKSPHQDKSPSVILTAINQTVPTTPHLCFSISFSIYLSLLPLPQTALHPRMRVLDLSPAPAAAALNQCTCWATQCEGRYSPNAFFQFKGKKTNQATNLKSVTKVYVYDFTLNLTCCFQEAYVPPRSVNEMLYFCPAGLFQDRAERDVRIMIHNLILEMERWITVPAKINRWWISEAATVKVLIQLFGIKPFKCNKEDLRSFRNKEPSNWKEAVL